MRPTEEAVTLFVCELQPIVIEGLKRVLKTCPDLKLIGESDSVADALHQIASHQPRIVLMDQSLGAKTTLEMIPRVRAVSLRSQPVLWIGNLTEEESFRALRTGVRGIVKKTLPVTLLIDCLRAVGHGNIWIEDSISNRVVGFLNRKNVPRLTSREQEIVALIGQGMKNKQIANRLSITTGTVKVHLMHIFEKTGVKRRFELALKAHEFVGDERGEAECAST